MTTPPKKPAEPEMAAAKRSTGTDKINAASELRWFFNRLRSTMTIADDLEKIGSMENAVAEGENAIKSLRQQQEDEKKKLSALEADVDAAKSEAKDIIDKAGKRAKEIEEASQKDGDKIRYAAQQKAEETIGAASTRSKAIENKIAQQNEVLNKLNADVATAQNRLDDINKQLDAVRRKVTA